MADDPEEGEEGETAGEDCAVELDTPHTGRHWGTSQQDGHSLRSSHRAAISYVRPPHLAISNNDIPSFLFPRLQFLMLVLY